MWSNRFNHHSGIIKPKTNSKRTGISQSDIRNLFRWKKVGAPRCFGVATSFALITDCIHKKTNKKHELSLKKQWQSQRCCMKVNHK